MKKNSIILFLIVLSSSFKAQEFLNYANLCFAKMDSIQLFTQWSRPVALDFDKDGEMDFAIINKANDSLQIFFNDGFAKFTTIPSLNIYIGNSGKDLCVADFNGDTYADIATIDAQGDMTVFKNLSGTAIMLINTFTNSVNPNLQSFRIEAADFNNDSQIDIIGTGKDFTTKRFLVYTFQNLGSFSFNAMNSFTVMAGHTILNNTPELPLAIADFNGDSYNDFIIGTDDNSDTLEIYKNLGSTAIGFAPPIIYLEPLGTPVQYIKTADYDGDSKTDFAIAAQGGFSINKNTGSLMFTNLYSNSTAFGIRFEIKDIDSDAYPDLVIVDYSGSFKVLRGTNPKGYPFGVNTFFFVGKGYRFLLENFDSNNIPDFVFAGDADYPYLTNFRNFTFNLSTTIISTNTVICSSTPVNFVVSNSDPYPGVFTWYPGPVIGANYSATTAGTYNAVFSYTLPPGYGKCYLYSDTLDIFAYPTPTASLASSAATAPVCAGTSVNLTASVTGATTYTWSTGSSNSSITVNPTSNTIYTLSLDNGCPGTETISVNVNPNPTVNITASVTTICIGDSVLLNGSGALTYQWSPASSTLPNIIVTPSVSTGYSLIGNNSFGCKDTAFINIVVNTIPTLTISASKPKVCLGDTTKLLVSGASTYTWNTGSNSSNISVIPSLVVNTYSVIGSNGCITTSSISITVYIPPIVTTAVSKSTVCNGDSLTLQAFGASTYTWAPPFLTGSSIYDYPSSNTTYTVLGQDINGCYNFALIPITVNNGATPTITASGELCIGKPITISVSGALSYTWDSGSNNPTFNVTPLNNSPLTYSVCSEDANGCKSSTSQTFNVSDKCQLVIYNGVTPNGDGHNDYFFLENIDQYPGNQVLIFNRWGQKLAEINDYNNSSKRWDGLENDNSKNVPSGTYFYVIDLKDGSDLHKGYIELTKNNLN